MHDEYTPKPSTATYDLKFAIVPRWITDSDISDRAVRLYTVMCQFADNDTGHCHPSRAAIAERMRGCSVDTVDRAMKELVSIGAVTVKHRTLQRSGTTKPQQLTSDYVIHRVPPKGGRKSAAPQPQICGTN